MKKEHCQSDSLHWWLSQKIQFNPGNLNSSYQKLWKDKNCIILADSSFTVDFNFTDCWLPCASLSHLLGEKGSVHWRTIAKNNMLYSNIIIIKQTAWFSNDTRMIEDGQVFFSVFYFWFASTWYRLRCNLLNLLLVGLKFQNQKRLKWTFSIQSTSGEHFYST